MNGHDYMKDLEIDLNNLHIDCQRHAALTMFYREQAIAANIEMAKAQNDVDTIKAVVDADVRLQPHKFGWSDSKKPTETFIENSVLLDQRYKDAFADLMSKTKTANLLAAAVQCFEHRKNMLGHEVMLFVNGMFSGVDDAVKQTASKLKKSEFTDRMRETIRNSQPSNEITE